MICLYSYALNGHPCNKTIGSPRAFIHVGDLPSFNVDEFFLPGECIHRFFVWCGCRSIILPDEEARLDCSNKPKRSDQPQQDSADSEELSFPLRTFHNLLRQCLTIHLRNSLDTSTVGNRRRAPPECRVSPAEVVAFQN